MHVAPPSRWLRRALVGAVLLMLTAASLSIAVSQILLGVTLVALVLGGRCARTRTGLERPTLLLFAWAALMVPFSTDPGQSLIFLRRFYLYAALWGVAAVAVDEAHRRGLFWALAAGGTVLAGWSAAAALVTTGDLFGRRMGEMSNPMTSGALLMMVGLVAVAVASTCGLARRTRLAAGAVAALTFVGLVQTLTRSAWLGYLVGLGTLTLVLRPRLAWAAAASVAGVVVLLFVLSNGVLPAPVAARFAPDSSGGDRATMRRLETWRGGLAMIGDRPLTGVGDRGLAAIAPEYYGDEDTLYHGHMHSNLVHIAVIWGVPGLLLALNLLGRQLAVPWRRWGPLRTGPRRGPPWARAWLLGAMAVWAAFFTAGLTEWYYGDAESHLMYLAVLGAALGGVPAAAADTAA